MTDTEKAGAAQAIEAIPLYHQIMDEMEHAAIDRCILAKYDDHEARQAFAAEVRAIRNLRETIGSLAKAGQPAPARQAPA